MPSHSNDRPTDSTPQSRAKSGGAPCRLLIGEQGQRRFRIHCRDYPIEAEHLSLILKEAGFEHPVKAAVPSQQLSGAFWFDSGSAKQFVGGVIVECNKVRHLVWIDAVSLPNLFGTVACDFVAPRRGELKEIPIVAGDKAAPPARSSATTAAARKSAASYPAAWGSQTRVRRQVPARHSVARPDYHSNSRPLR
jgi:hypothetical protein